MNWWQDCYVALMAPTDLDLISHLMSFNEAWIGNIRLLSLATSTGGGADQYSRQKGQNINMRDVSKALSHDDHGCTLQYSVQRWRLYVFKAITSYIISNSKELHFRYEAAS